MFSRYSPYVWTALILQIFVCGDFENPWCIQLELKMKRHFSKRILCVLNHSQPPPDLWKGTHADIDSGGGSFEHFFELWLDKQ